LKYNLQQSPKELNLRVDIYDEVGIGGGASGISGGLLHPYSPKGFSFYSRTVLLWSVDTVDCCFPWFCCVVMWCLWNLLMDEW